MEEENIIIYNEDNNLETVDILESDNDIAYDETIQVVEVDEPEIYNVGAEGAFPALGAQNEALNHTLMMNRDLPDQHTIGSITGLEETIDDIYSLKTVESDKIGLANYYKWRDMDDVPSGSDRFGRFVSLHGKDNKISICDRDNQIFGVTVDSAGFVGEQDENGRNDEYCLVATTGVVKVRCRENVVPSTDLNRACYVMSDDMGLAYVCQEDDVSGFYVIAVEEMDDGHDYAVISLDSTMNQLHTMSEAVAGFQDDLDVVESRVTAAINTASNALKNSLEQNINTAMQNAQEALNNSETAVNQVGDLTSEVGRIDTKVDAVFEGIVLEYQELARQAVDELTNGTISTMQEDIEQALDSIATAQATADSAYEEASRLINEIDPIVSFTNEDGTVTGVSGFVAKTEDNTTKMAAISRCLNNGFVTLDTWIGNSNANTGVIYYTQDTKLYHYYDDGWKTTYQAGDAGLLEVIADISQQTSDEEAVVTSLTSYSDRKYETIEVWDGYEEVDDWEQVVAKANPNIIYYDTTTETYWQCDRYTEDGDPWSSVEIETGVLELKETDTVYYAEDTKLYYYYDNGWKTSPASVAPWIKSVAMTKQLTDANSARIDNIVNFTGEDGEALAVLSQKADANEASITALTSYVENGYEEIDDDEVWTSSGKETDTIYYAKELPNDETKKYWYYQNGTWHSSTNPADAGLSASLANVNQEVTKNGASITNLLTWQNGVNTDIAYLKANIDEGGGSIESAVINIGKYAVGEYSQAYGLTLEEAINLLRDGTVFVPTKDVVETYWAMVDLNEPWDIETEEQKYKSLVYHYFDSSTRLDYYYYYHSIHSEWASTISASQIRNYKEIDVNFLKGRYYTWNKEDGRWENSSSGAVTFASSYISGTENAPYMVIENKFTSENLPNLEVGDLYHWENSKWKRVATEENNTLNRTISQMRQTSNEISTRVTDIEGNVASIDEWVDANSSNIELITTYGEKLTEIEQKSDNNEAKISMLVASGVERVNVWNASEHTSNEDKAKIFYDGTNYYYYDNGWMSTTDFSNSHVATKIRSAGIITSINNDSSEIKISGDKIDITADNIDMTGKVTFNSFSNDLKSKIDNKGVVYCTCDTGHDDNYKIIKENGSILKRDVIVGTQLCVRFTYGNEYEGDDILERRANTCLQFNNNNNQEQTYTITYNGDEVIGSTPDVWSDNSTIYFIYDGDSFAIQDNLAAAVAGEAKTTALSAQSKADQAINGLTVHYGVCDTSSSYSEKTVTIGNLGNTISKDTVIAVYFNYNNSTSSPTLKVNNGTAYNMKQYDINGNISAFNTWGEGKVYYFILDNRSGQNMWINTDSSSGMVSSAMQIVKACVDNDQTLIDGSRIYTGSISADSIDTDNITATTVFLQNIASKAITVLNDDENGAYGKINMSHLDIDVGELELSSEQITAIASQVTISSDYVKFTDLKNDASTTIANAQIKNAKRKTYGNNIEWNSIATLTSGGFHIFKDDDPLGGISSYYSVPYEGVTNALWFNGGLGDSIKGMTMGYTIGDVYETIVLLERDNAQYASNWHGGFLTARSDNMCALVNRRDFYNGPTLQRVFYSKCGVGAVDRGRSNNPPVSIVVEDEENKTIARLDIMCNMSGSTANGGCVLRGQSLKGTKLTDSQFLTLGENSLWWGSNLMSTESSEKYKKNIAKPHIKALKLVNDSVIYNYKYKEEPDDNPIKYGLIIERECPIEVIDNSGDAINLYSMTSIAWKAIQELSDKVSSLEEELSKLKGE